MSTWRKLAEKWNRFDEWSSQWQFLPALTVGLGFALLLVGGYLQVLHLLPEHTHFIRQTDSWAFAAHYAQFQNPILEPSVYNLASDGGKAACEFPLMYWLQSKFYAVNGISPVIPRIESLALNLTGIVWLFLSLARTSKSAITAFIATSWAAGSALFLFYSPNFLPDSLALAFTCMALAHVVSHSEKQPWTVTSALLFVMAALLKPTFFIYPIAWFARLLLVEKHHQRLHRIWPFIAMALPVLAWNWYAINYNAEHHDTYFMMRSAPVWSMSMTQINETWDYITRYWITSLFHPSGLHFCAIALLGSVVIALLRKRKPPLFESALLAGSIAFVVLFFEKLKDHDYYFLTLIPAFILLMQCALMLWRSSSLPAWLVLLVQLTLLVMSGVNMHYGSQRAMKRFFHPEKSTQELVMSWIGAQEQAMVQRCTLTSDTLWIEGDNSPNAGLMLVGRKGYTDFNEPAHTLENTSPLYILRPTSFPADTLIDNTYTPVAFSDKAILFKRK